MFGYKVSNFADVKMGFTWCLHILNSYYVKHVKINLKKIS